VSNTDFTKISTFVEKMFNLGHSIIILWKKMNREKIITR